MHAAHRVPLEPGSPRSIIDEGEAYTVRGKNGVKVRQDVGKGSAQLCDLREGTEVRVLETHTLEDGTERARITALEAGVVSAAPGAGRPPRDGVLPEVGQTDGEGADPGRGHAPRAGA